MPWWLGRSCHPTRLASQLASQQCTRMPQNGAERPVSPIRVHSCVPSPVHNGATVYTNAPKWLREAVFADLCTLLRPHDRSRDRVGLWVPRHRRPHGSCDARALGPEAHAARAVTRPPTHMNSRSLPCGRLIDTGKRVSERVVRDVWNVVMMLYLSYAHGHQEPFEL